MAMAALSTHYDPKDQFVAGLSSEGGPWQLVCSAPSEELCRKRLEDRAVIYPPCDVRMITGGKKPAERKKPRKAKE